MLSLLIIAVTAAVFAVAVAFDSKTAPMTLLHFSKR